MGNSEGVFTMNSAFQIVRKSRVEVQWMDKMRITRHSFKIAFFFWRVYKIRIAIDDNLKKMKVQIVFKSRCCDEGGMETMCLFLTTPIAQKLSR